MAKIIIGGETFDYDGKKQPMSEALAIEERLRDSATPSGRTTWRPGRRRRCACSRGSSGGATAATWPFADILDGKVDFDLGEMLQSIIESAEAAAAEAKAAAADPTAAADPAGTPATATGTSESSRSGSGSGRGRSTRSSASDDFEALLDYIEDPGGD